MSNDLDQLQDHLKRAVEKKYGRQIIYSKDCWALSSSIQKETGRLLSDTTLKRFFKLVNSKFNASRFTLDTLAIYVGCKNWNEYLNIQHENPEIEISAQLWNKLKHKAESFTSFYYNSIRGRIGIKYNQTIDRKFSEKHLETFLQSDKRATAFIAPGGYGKSTLLIKLIDKYFIGEKALYPDDILWLIDGSIINNLLTENFNVNEYLLRLMGEYSDLNLQSHFIRHPDQLKGRIILAIDGLNEITHRLGNNRLFVENLFKLISYYDGAPWFKIIITCRTSIWNIISRSINKYPHYKNKWFGVNFGGNFIDLGNVPLFDRTEVAKILDKSNLFYCIEEAELNNPSFIERINIPYFLQLFITSFKEDRVISDIDILNSFTYEAILDGIHGEEKYLIIESILKKTEYGLKGDSIDKAEIQHMVDKHPEAYNELVSFGIIYEFKQKDKYFSFTTKLKFSHDILFEFFLTNLWLKENEFDMDLMEHVANYYCETTELQFGIITWLIKYAFSESKIDILLKIYHFLNRHFIQVKNRAFYFKQVFEYINTIACEIRKYKEIRKLIIPEYAKSFITQTLYFERFIDMDFLLVFFAKQFRYYDRYKHTKDAKIYSRCISFWSYFYTEDTANCRLEFNKLTKITATPNIKPQYLSMYIHCYILALKIKEGEIPASFIERIYQIEKDLFHLEAKRISYFPYYHFAVMDAFSLTEMFAESIEFYKNVCADIQISDNLKRSRSYKFMLLFYAEALLMSGKKAKAISIFNDIELNNLQDNSKYYWTIRYSLIKCRFLEAQHKHKQLEKKVKRIIEISRLLGYKYFISLAKKYETIKSDN